MMTLIYILIGTIVVSLGSFAGVLTLGINKNLLNKLLLSMVGLSSGALLGVAFIHMVPEGIEQLSPDKFCLTILITIVAYLLIEKVLHWRHCHDGVECHEHTMGYMSLIGDSLHNFIDGLIIASAFVVNPALGISTIFAIALHEIPQEIGDFAVLLYAGFSKQKAILLNVLVSGTAILGGVVGWFISEHTDRLNTYLIPIAVGGFIYIALSDILPELRKENNMKKFFSGFTFFLLGIVMMFFLRD